MQYAAGVLVMRGAPPVQQQQQQAPAPADYVSEFWGRVSSGAVCVVDDGGPRGPARRWPLRAFGAFV